MKTKIYLTLLASALIFTFGFTQTMTSDGSHFLVDFESFSPPVKEMAMSFEGRPAEQFLANDIQGNEHFLGDYKGKKVILWFWSKDETLSTGHINALNATQEHNKDLVILSFARGSKEDVKSFADANKINFPVIPNADVFGQMAYAADLGYPRYFFIDEYGIIKQVWPAESFQEGINPYNAISDMLIKI